MRSCDDCAERLLDYVYGLLEGTELQETREHLRSCAECQAALDQVQGEQKLMARAAKAIHDVPEFTLPNETIETLPAASAPVAPLPTSLPRVGSEPKGGRSLWQRPWVAWTIAASLLFVIGGSYSYHQYQVTSYQKDLALQRSQFHDVDVAYEALPTKYELLQKREIDKLRDGANPYVHIVGPTQLQPNAKAQLRITTRNADGELAPSNGRIKLVEVPSGHIVQMERWQTDRDGHALLELDASKAKPKSTLQVIVDAELAGGHASVKDTIRLQPPTYVTRVDTNKIAYQIDDVLFFRVLVLDRCSLQPPAQPILVRVELKNPKNEVVARIDAATSEGGIFAREFPIARTFLAGSYTLNVSPLDPAQTLVQSAMQKLEVVRDLRTPEILLDQLHYAAGDRISGTVRGNALAQKAIGRFGNEKPVPVTIEPNLGGLGGGGIVGGFAGGFGGGGGGVPPTGGGGLNLNTKETNAGKKDQADNYLGVQRFSAQLPEKLEEGARFVPLTLEFEDGKTKQEFRGVVPIGPTDYDVDFFPEGGDLVAGVPNRVYYRVRTRDGDAVMSDGRVILMAGNNEFIDSRYHLGLGYFDFTPNTKEVYSVRITTPAKTAEIAQPFAKVGGIRPTGVVLHIPSAVGKQGDAIRVTLRNQGPARKLLLAAHCRGQIVDQRWVDVKTGSQDFTLQPAPDARGMIKVTAYEVVDDAVLPIAERLVYRTPVQRLELGLRLSSQYLEPGKNVQMNITARTEAGDPATGWLLASVVDERFQPRTRSLSAHFMLLNEIRTGSELEDAQVVLHDSPESTALLERFLGTHGWRRFLHRGEAAAAGKPNDATPLVFSRESTSLEQLQKDNEAKYAAALEPLRKAAFAEEIQLKSQRAHLSGMVMFAQNQLHQYEDGVQMALRLSLGVLLALLLIASVSLMAVGIVRIVRRHQAATPAFGGAFGCLALCLLVMLVGSLLGPVQPTNIDADGSRVAVNLKVETKLNEHLANAPVPRGRVGPAAQVGVYAMHQSKPAADAIAQSAMAKHDDQRKMNDAAVALQTLNYARMARLEQVDRAGNAGQIASNLPRQNFAKAAARAQGTLTTPPKPAAKGGKAKSVQVAPTPPPKMDVPVAPLAAADEVEYAFQYAPKTFADTLLWHPRLQLVNGQGDVRFDIPTGQASYRVLLLGHTPTGRFGFYESRVDVHGVGK